MAERREMVTPADMATTGRFPVPGAVAIGLRVRRPDTMVRRVRAGFDFSRWEQMERRSGLTREQLATMAAITIRTLARRQKAGQLNAEESDRLLRAARIFEQVIDLFEGDAVAARQWLLKPAVGLGGETPLVYASTEIGAREVERLIGRLEHGVLV